MRSPATHAHVIVDLQREFCDPSYGSSNNVKPKTRRTAQRVEKLSHMFRAANVPTVIVYYHEDGLSWEHARGGLFALTPAPADTVIGKYENSAFASSPLTRILRGRDIETIWVSGFYSTQCVRETALHGVRLGFGVQVMADAVCNPAASDKKTHAALQDMYEQGVQPVLSPLALEKR